MAVESREIYRFDEFRLDTARGTLHGSDGVQLALRPKGFALLRYLLDHPGVLHGREALIDTLWPGVVVTDDSLTQCMGDLRRALGDRAAHVLRTVSRRGYLLVAEVTREVLGETGPATAVAPALPVAALESAAPVARMASDGRCDLVILEPLDGAAEDPAVRYLAGSLDTELIAEFARFEKLRLIAAPGRGNGADYRVRGTLRLAGETLHLAVRLEEAASGAVLWAHRAEAPAAGPLDGVIGRLVSLIARQIDRQSLARARPKPLSMLTPRELCLLAREHHQRGTEVDTRMARELFDRAIRIDPDFAVPYAWQAYTVHRAITHGWGSPTGQQARDLSLALARRAVDLSPESPLCLSRLAFSLMLNGRWEPAVDAARMSLRSNRNADHSSRNTAGEVLAHAGYPEEAVEAVQWTIALDPHCPPTTRAVLGRALVLAGRMEEALPELRWCSVRLPDYPPAYHSLVVAAAETGRIDEAREALRETIRLQPAWKLRDHTGAWFFRRDRDAERFLAAFRSAGWVDAVGSPPGVPSRPVEKGLI